jgi:hypothetical protein
MQRRLSLTKWPIARGTPLPLPLRRPQPPRLTAVHNPMGSEKPPSAKEDASFYGSGSPSSFDE